jgi:hypothetical protein
MAEGKKTSNTDHRREKNLALTALTPLIPLRGGGSGKKRFSELLWGDKE